jgi:dTDP-4-dehydrorhamnose 3,5-epimerase
MEIIKTKFEDLYVIEPKVWEDDRGYFFESFNRLAFKMATGLNIDFIQDNESKSVRGVLRGLHFQTGIYAQSKLVRVVEGTVLDVAVDLRPDSKTYGEYFSIMLSEINKKQLFIPKGFAHGFITISKNAIFLYKCDNYYNKKAEDGIDPLDMNLNINWVLSPSEFKLSDKDKTHQSFKIYNEKSKISKK